MSQPLPWKRPPLSLIGTAAHAALLDAIRAALDGEAACAIHLLGDDGALPAPVPSGLALLVLPDSVPGGSGQLRFLAGQEAGLRNVIVVCSAQELEPIMRRYGDVLSDFVLDTASLGEILARLRRALATCLPTGGSDIPAQALAPWRQRGIVGQSPLFLAALAKLGKIAASGATVLILGETGTGKEVFAQAVHDISERAGGPMVAINCGAIPADLVEDELFGHVKGAYTTAHGARDGLVRAAEGGTLFLDDIDGLPLAAQAKLLRFLQEREFRPVGSNTVLRANVRVIAASNRDLAAWCQAGRFREDLYFRINVLSLHVPPLRERCDDIPALAEHYLAQFGAAKRPAVTGLSPAALHKLLMHDWPGNVRELKSVIERAVVLAQGARLEEHEIELHSRPAGATETFKTMKANLIRNFERGYIERLLISTHGNVSAAAQLARKNRRAFFELIRKHAIEPEGFRERADTL